MDNRIFSREGANKTVMISGEKKKYITKATGILLSVILILTGCESFGDIASISGDEVERFLEDSIGQKAEAGDLLPDTPLTLTEADELPEWEWQAQAVFPDRKGKVDDTLAMNSLLTFEGFHGQGKL